MAGIENRIARIIPRKLKNVIEPFYRRMKRILVRPTVDRPSVLTIGSWDGFEIAYRKGTADCQVLSDAFERDIPFSGVPEYQPADNHVIIDIGAHIGAFALLSSSKVKHGRIHAIEACEESFNYLRINAALNQSANITLHHLAITDREGTCSLYHSSSNWGHSTVQRRYSDSSERVRACTLSHFMENNQIDKCDFMKLNCEGAEFPILLSTPGDLLKRLETILVMYHCDLWAGNTEVDLLDHLQRSGFKCVIRNRRDKRGWIIATNTENHTRELSARGDE